MKKTWMAAFAIVCMVCAFQPATAQANKFGYFDLEYVLSLMPGVERVDSLLEIFDRDSLAPERSYELEEFQRMDSTLKADSAKMPARLYQQRMQEQAQRFYKLQNWQQYAQQVLQAKQQELMAPYLNKVLDAFQQIVADGKYTYVFKRESLWQAPPADNLIIPVAKKLNLKLPPELLQSAEQPKPSATQPAPVKKN